MAHSRLIDADPNNYSTAEAALGLAEAFEPIGNQREEGPWSDFPTLAAWVEYIYESSTRHLDDAKGSAERYARDATRVYDAEKEEGGFGPNEDALYYAGVRKEAKTFEREYAAEASRLTTDIERFLATVGPTGATYGSILDEVRARKEREDSRSKPEQVPEAIIRTAGRAALRACSVLNFRTNP